MELHHKQNNLPKLSYMCWERDSGGFGFAFNLFSYFLNQLHCYCSVAQPCQTLCNSMGCISPGFPVLHHLWEFTQSHVHWVGDATRPSHPLFPLLFLPSIFPSIRVFSSKSAKVLEPKWPKWPKYWSFSINLVLTFFSLYLSDRCFWTVVLEKILESPLNCKEIQPVHPKGDQSWVFIGRTDAEAATPILWPPDAKSWLIWKDPDAGKDWG